MGSGASAWSYMSAETIVQRFTRLVAPPVPPVPTPDVIDRIIEQDRRFRLPQKLHGWLLTMSETQYRTAAVLRDQAAKLRPWENIP